MEGGSPRRLSSRPRCLGHCRSRLHHDGRRPRVPSCRIPDQLSSPYEIGLGWTVRLDDREPFIGQDALRLEAQRGSPWALVGLEINWEDLESVFDAQGLPPSLPMKAWRDAIPVYVDGRPIGRATSGAWSPIMKKNLALATVRSETTGQNIDIEVTVRHRKTCGHMLSTLSLTLARNDH